MDTHNESEDRLQELLLLLPDGDATTEQIAELNDLIRSDVYLRQLAAEFLCDESRIMSELGVFEDAASLLLACQQESFEDEQKVTRVSSQSVDESHCQSHQTRTSNSSSSGVFREIARKVNQNGMLVLAACLGVFLLIGWHYIYIQSELDRLYALVAAPDPFQMESLKGKPAEEQSSAVARVTGLIDCQWPDGARGLQFGDYLTEGEEVTIDSGVVQLTLDTGTRVLVEGPASFIATSRSETELSLGRIAASVPRAGRGYTVLTPTAEIVDLGTEFGVHVDRSGASKVYVFDGDVVARKREEEGGAGRVVHASVEDAYLFEASDESPKRIERIVNGFVRQLKQPSNDSSLPDLPVVDGLSLWMAADQLANVDVGDKVATWDDLLVGDNTFANDAWQFEPKLQPTLIRDTNGHYAVKFDGWSTSLVTGPTELTDQQSIFVVCSVNPTSFAKHSKGGVVLKAGPMTLSVRNDHSPIGWMSESGRKVDSRVDVADGKTIQPLEPFLVNYVYDSQGNKASIAVNGDISDNTNAPVTLPKQVQCYFGRSEGISSQQYFFGNVYEILMYSSPLSPAETAEVTRYLSQRYNVTLDR